MFAVDELARHWWVIGLRGLAAILFGILAFVWPGVTITVLVILFGAYALVDGVLAIIAAFRGDTSHRWTLGLEGLVGVIAGIVTFAIPAITAIALLYVIAFWAIVTGVIEIVAAIRLRRTLTNELGLIIGGVVSVLFGLYLAIFPGAGVLTVVYLIGIYAIIFGITLLALAWRLRSHHEGALGGHAAAAPV